MSTLHFPSRDATAHAPRRGVAPRLLRSVGMAAVAAIALTGLSLSQSAPAHADATQRQTWVFDSPSGTDWIVPAGIAEVVVGLRGGRGGDGDIRTAGRGANFAVVVPVKQGDRLTVYAGKNAHGKSDAREGGAGFVSGGNGGKGSLTGSHGGGGGGASALKVNGELVAVAGGGGGGGGYSGNPTIKMTLQSLLTLLEASGGYTGGSHTGGTLEYRAGGAGAATYANIWGSGHRIEMTAPASGVGSKPGAPGKNGIDDSVFGGFHKAGSNGGSAGYLTGGGAGGAGGGGWPSSGTGGGAGRTFWHFSAGAGGGAGMSWISDSMPGLRFDRDAMYPEDSHTYSGPLADSDTVKIFVPLKSMTTVAAPAQVEAGQPISLRVRTADSRTPNAPLDGRMSLFLPGQNTPIDSHSGNGDHTFTVPGLPAGEHTFRVDFIPGSSQRDYNWESTFSSGTATVTVVDPAPSPQPESVDVTTTTTLSLESSPAVYGDLAVFTAVVEIDGPYDLSMRLIDFEVDGTPAGQSVLIYIGGGRYGTIFPFFSSLAAGTHSVIARFDGVSDGDPTTPDALPSVSAPIQITLGRAATRTEIVSAPSPVRAFAPIDVTAAVSASAVGFDGSAVLLADGGPLMYADLAADGSVRFDQVVVPWGSAELTVAYLGDTAGNFALSTSDPLAIEVTAIETATALGLSRTEVRADGTVTLSATVTNVDPADSADPRGEIEILFDGEVVYSVPAGHDIDPETDDGEARFELDATDLLLGEHLVSARFVPAPGFSASVSGQQSLRVVGIETSLVLSADEVTGTPSRPAFVEITAHESGQSAVPFTMMAVAVTSNGDPVDGYVQAFVGSDPLGDPVGVSDGRGRIELTGLGVGVYQVELRFTPAEQRMLKSAATVTVTVAADSGSNDGRVRPNGLSTTGGPGPLPLVFGAVVLLLAAGALWGAARRRRS